MRDAGAPPWQRMGLLLGGVIFAFFCGEVLARAFDLDFLVLRRALYFQCYCLQIHRVSFDARRLYELTPNTTARGMPFVHPKENQYETVDVSINALGFRGKSFSSAKRPGIFRIVIFGGSNTFGPSVREPDTYPAQLQKIFDEKYPDKVEVWNAGVSAYVMSQNVAYAETVIEKYDPDLLIFQDTNSGRRAFHRATTTGELKGLFKKNKELFIENIPPLWDQKVFSSERARYFFVSKASQIHHGLVVISSLYRSLCLGFYSWRGVFYKGDPARTVKDSYASLWNYEGQKVSHRDLNQFIKRHWDKKIILFSFSKSTRSIGAIERRPNHAEFTLPSEEKPSEYRAMHPPSYVYAWYAKELCAFLIEKGYLPTKNIIREETVAL